MENTVSIRDQVTKLGQLVRPSEVDISEYRGINRRGVLLALVKKEDQELLLCLPDEAVFGEVIELWKGNFYSALELWFIPNDKRSELARNFVKIYGKEEEVQKNPLRFKGLGWDSDAYWVAIANDSPVSQQGELFPKGKQEPIPLNIGNNEIFKMLKKAVAQGKLSSLTVYKIKKTEGDRFRLIYPWWLQKNLFQQLSNTERLENAG